MSDLFLNVRGKNTWYMEDFLALFPPFQKQGGIDDDEHRARIMDQRADHRVQNAGHRQDDRNEI